MGKILLNILVFIACQVCFSQTYRLTVSSTSCSRSDPTIDIYDINGNIILSSTIKARSAVNLFTSTTPPRRMDITHLSCPIPDDPYDRYKNYYYVAILPLGDCVALFGESYSFEARLSVPLDTLDKHTESICDDGDFFIQAHNDCHGYTYRWKYSTNGVSFYNMGVTTTGTESHYPSLNSLLGDSYTGPLHIKAEISYDDGISYTDVTNIVTYTISASSPGLQDVQPRYTKCSYSSDGGFTAYFERGLNPGEELLISVYEKNGQGLGSLVDTTSPGEGAVLGTNNSFEWPRDLPVGTYIMRYQSLGGCLGDDGEFTIGSPDPVTFSAAWLNDVSCHGGSDGAVALEARGGDGGYRYALNGQNPVPFTNTGANASHTVSGLPKGNHSFKVVDKNNCIGKKE